MALLDKINDFILLEKESIEKEMTKGAIKKTKTKIQKIKDIKIQKSVIKNVVSLYDKRYIIIDVFTAKNILPENLEKDIYWEEEPNFEESIGERTKMKRQNQDGQGLKILTPQQILCRLPISLSPLKAGNNS